MLFLVSLISGFLLLRLNSKLERRLASRRRMHAIVSPLYSYLGLLDHELQNETHHADRLITQAVLDHVTELRSFLLQPQSKDLTLWKQWHWIQRLNNVLMSLEDSLEGAIQESWDDHFAEIKEGVVHLSAFIKDTPTLKAMSVNPVGVVVLK